MSDARTREAAWSVADWLNADLLAQVVDQVGDGVAAFDREGRLVYANSAIARLNGVPPERLRGANVTDFVDLPAGLTLGQLQEHLASSGTVTTEQESTAMNGSPMRVELTLSPLSGAAGELLGHVVCVHDVSERHRLRAQLQHAADHDGLTGLLNRRAVIARLGQAMAAPEAPDLAVVYLDLDGFKTVNDTLGHTAGDALLIEVADRLRSSVRESDLVARIGGDEFVVVLCDLEDADTHRRLVERLGAAFRAPFAVGGRSRLIAASIGVATWRGERPAEALIQAADTAMYVAKNAGGGQIRDAVDEGREAARP